MKKGIVVSSVVLSNAFKECMKVKPNSHIPIMESFLLECSPDKVYLVRSNIDDTVKVELGCECNFTGAFLLEASVGKLMAKVEEQPISININDDDVTKVFIYGEGFQTVILVGNPMDYIANKGKYKKVGSMSYNELRSNLERLVPFLATDELRPAMTGFCIDEKNMMATNGYMVRVIPYSGFKIPISKPEGGQPGKNEFILTNIFKYLPKNKMKDVITFSLSEDRLRVKIEFYGHTIYSRLIDERYPDYEAVWVKNEDFVTEFKLKTLELKRTLEQALVFANQSTKHVVINVGTKVDIHTEDLDYETEFNRTIEDVETSGKGMEIGVNGKLLLECMKHFDSEVKFQLAAPNRALILNDEVLIMPVMLGN